MIGKVTWSAAGLVLLLPLVATLSLLIGPSMWDDHVRWQLQIDPLLIFTSRLPRTVALFLCGGSVSVAGLIMQMMTRNRYVEPGTTGSMQGAALGILLAAIFWPDTSIMVRILLASGGALITTMLFLLLLRPVQQENSALLVPVIGLMYCAVLAAFTTFLALHYDLLQSLISWQSGDFSSVLAGRYELIWLAVPLIALLWWLADSFTVLALGQAQATTLGLDYRALMLLGVVAVALLSGMTAALIGALPFIGLVIPNLVRVVVGDNTRRALPWTFLGGSLLSLLCDVLGRLLVFPYEIPAGALLSVVGALLFLYLLSRHR